MITIDSSFKTALHASTLTRFLNRAGAAVGLSGAVDVLLSDDATLRRLNRSFRGKNKATDVLSFPSPPEIASIHAGDLAISLETASRQAETYGHTLADEVRILLLHGLLHLSGMDHETDAGEMAARESDLRRQLRLSTTLIERVESRPASLARKVSASKPPARKAAARKTSPSRVAVKTASSKPRTRQAV